MRHDEVEAVRKVELNRFKQRVSISMKVLVLVIVAVVALSGTTASILKGISPKMGEAVIPVSFGIVFLCFAVLLLWSLFSTNKWESLFERQYVPARLKQDWPGVQSVAEELDLPESSAWFFENPLVFPMHNHRSVRSMYLVNYKGGKGENPVAYSFAKQCKGSSGGSRRPQPSRFTSV